jgi:hypothetical protein
MAAGSEGTRKSGGSSRNGGGGSQAQRSNGASANGSGSDPERADSQGGGLPGLGEAASLVGGLVGGIAKKVQMRVPKADLDERDPDYIRESLPRLWMLASIK